MGEDRIKSAREIATERLANMPGLTPEELREQREKEYAPRGTAIARRYLQGTLRSGELSAELERYQGQEAEVVKRALLTTLCDSITSGDCDTSLKALDGIAALAGEADLTGIRREVESLAAEHEERLRERRSVIERREKKKLSELGISGPAVRPNVSEGQEWLKESSQLQAAFGERAGAIRKSLLALFGL